MDTLTSLKAFRQIVESGSFAAAAERLDISNAMISKHVMSLEKRLGVRLLNRNSRTLSLTEPGRLYFERCKAVLDDLDATERELGSLGATPRGTLRITAPSWLAGLQRMSDLLMDYHRQCPDVLVDISFEDRLVDLVDEGFDLAIRSTRPESLPAGLIARPLRPTNFYLTASREYLERHGVPRTPEDLARHAFVAVGNLSSFSLVGPEGLVEVPIRVVLRYRSIAGVANAVAAGFGLGPMPAIHFEDPVFKQVLVPVLTDYPFRQSMLYLVYVSRKYVPLKIRSFIDFFVAATAQAREPKIPAAP